VQVVSSYAYVADGYRGLDVLDVSNPTNILWLGGHATGGVAGRVQVVGQYAFLADEETGLHIFDVTQPTNVVRVGGYLTDVYTPYVEVVGNHALLCSDELGIQVFDVSNPSNVVLVATHDTAGYPRPLPSARTVFTWPIRTMGWLRYRLCVPCCSGWKWMARPALR
jgi:hypothetical protein